MARLRIFCWFDGLGRRIVSGVFVSCFVFYVLFLDVPVNFYDGVEFAAAGFRDLVGWTNIGDFVQNMSEYSLRFSCCSGRSREV